MFEISKVLFEIIFVVRGYHDILEAEINSELHCLPEPDNCEDGQAEVLFRLF